MAYSFDQIKQVLKDLANDIPVAKIANDYSISTSTIYNWKKKYSLDIEAFKTSKTIKNLIKQRKYKEALKLACDKKFENNFPIQSQKITILIKLKKLEEALKLASDKKFENDFFIQSQRIDILIKLKRLEEALALACNKKFENYPSIQSQRINILIKLKRLEKALAVACNKNFDNDFLIQSQKVTILIKLNRLKEALELASDKKFENYHRIKSKIEYIKSKINSPKNKQNDTIANNKIKVNFKNILNNIVNANTTENTILDLNIYEWQKMILIIAFYEKNNYPLNISLKYLKRQQIIYQENASVLKIINKLLARIKAKNKILNAEFYLSLLDSKVEFKTTEKDYLNELANNISNKQDNTRERKLQH